MAKTPAIGHTACPVCPQIADVKLDKAGRAYLYCPDCNIQLFSRYEHQSKFLLAKMRPVAKEEPAPTITEPPPKKSGFRFEDL